MSAGFAVLAWHKVVTAFADSHTHWAQPHFADGACFFASACLLDDLRQVGVAGELYETGSPRNDERGTIYAGHYFVVVDGWAVDFTARQFWPSTPFPILQRLSEYRERFNGVYPSAEDWAMQA